MTTPSNTTSGSLLPEDSGDSCPNSWERVASSLRACKDAQKQAWGDLDSSTLGRYLAGEVAVEEMRRIERELADHPELRQLTDLVRDVLGGLEPIREAEPGPTVLSFEKARRPRRVLPFLRRHAALVAAACLLVVLGAVVPTAGLLPSRETVLATRSTDQVPFLGNAVARASATSPTALFTTLDSSSLSDLVSDAAPPPRGSDSFLGQTKADVLPADRTSGVRLGGRDLAPVATDAKKMSSRDVADNHRRGQDYLRRGQVNDAEKSLAMTYAHCQESLGAKHPITTRTAQELANLYAPALNDGLASQARKTSAPNPASAPAFVTPADKRREEAESLGEQIAGSTLPHLQATVVPVLVRALETAPTPAERQTMVVALGNLGSAASPALPALRQRLDNASPAERRAILHTMGRIGPASVPILDRLAGNNLGKNEFRYYLNEQTNLSENDQKLVRVTLLKLQSPEAQAGIADEAACLSFREIRTASMRLHRLAKAKDLGILVLIQTKAGNRPDDAARLARLGKYGVHVILDLSGQVEVKVSPALESTGFSAAAVRAAMLAPCKAKQYDNACSAGIDHIRMQAEKLKLAR